MDAAGRAVLLLLPPTRLDEFWRPLPATEPDPLGTPAGPGNLGRSRLWPLTDGCRAVGSSTSRGTTMTRKARRGADEILALVDAHGDVNAESVAFSPSGEWLASGGADGTMKLWDLVDGRELFRSRGTGI